MTGIRYTLLHKIPKRTGEIQEIMVFKSLDVIQYRSVIREGQEVNKQDEPSVNVCVPPKYIC